MNLSSLSIKRPVLATVLGIAILIFGGVGYSYLGVREYPSVDPPIVTVETNYAGANAAIIESRITEPLEENINSVSGIKTISSVSSDGRSSITVEFDLSKDMNAAVNDVRDKVSRTLDNLPPDADPPVVERSDADAETILAITIKSDERDLLELTDIGIRDFKERLQTIEGISRIYLWGEKMYSMRLQLDPRKMAAYDLTPGDVEQAIQEQNVELPSGRVEGYNSEMTIRVLGRLNTEEEFNDMIVEERENVNIRLKDVGEARLAPRNQRTFLRGDNGVPMIGVAIQPQPGANYIEVVDQVHERVDRISSDLPDDLELGIGLDATQSIRKAIDEVQNTVFIAFGLVVLVIFFFLRNWRTTLIPIMAIPIALVGSFFVMYIAGFSINLLTLLGVVLVTGLVVDDAIVVMENIFSRMEKYGESSIQAGFKGSREVFFAIISTTITLASVFLPIIFMEGITGRLFREFGIVVAGAVLISSFVSLSITPMMSSRILKLQPARTRISRWIENGLQGMIDGYRRTLDRFLNVRWLALPIMILAIGAIIGIGSTLPSEMAPLEDKSRLRVFATAPEGVAYERMDRYMQELLEVADTLPEKRSLLAVTSPGFGSSININSGFLRIRLVPPNEREKSQMQLADELSKEFAKKNFARAYVTQEQTIQAGNSGLGGLPVQFVLQAPSIDKLEEVLPKFMERAQQHEAFQAVNRDLKFTKPELELQVNREKARKMGVSVRDVAETLQLMYSGQRVGYFLREGKQYDVITEAPRLERDEPKDLEELSVQDQDGNLIPLKELVEMRPTSSSPERYRYNRYVSATVSANPAAGLTLGEGIEAMQGIADEVLDESFQTDLAGPSEEFAESSNSLFYAFALALVLVYLALSAQFESFRNPLTIMLTVPLAIAGALITLWLFGHTLNIFSQIGMIVLIGIVTKNGILIVEFAEQRKEAGLSIREGIVDASARRFRPILMTNLATILGALPIALALGGASTSRIPMGVAIIGGLTFSLVLTLYVIPALYTYIASSTVRGNVEEEP